MNNQKEIIWSNDIPCHRVIGETRRGFYLSHRREKLRYQDNREIKLGITHSVTGHLVFCRNGLHASERLIDTILYSHYNILWLVELSKEILIGSDKMCARSRTYLARWDITGLLMEFSAPEYLARDNNKQETERYNRRLTDRLREVTGWDI